MKKIKVLTAIGNENLNNILKNQNEFEILENDIFYKEGILEFLEKNKDAWTIKDDKIQFTNLNRMTEYYNLLNKLTD